MWTNPVSPTSGTVITVAWATSNVVDPLMALRTLTGGADPPASGYVVVSDSTTGTSWQKVPDDALADPKVSKTGDTMSGNLSVPNVTVGNTLTSVIAVITNYMTIAGTLSVGGAFSAISAVIAGTINATAMVLTGAFQAAAATITGGLSAGTITSPGTITGATLASNGNVTAVGVVNSGTSMSVGTTITIGTNAQVNGVMNAGLLTQSGVAASLTGHTHATSTDAATLGGRSPGNASNNIPINNGVENVNLVAQSATHASSADSATTAATATNATTAANASALGGVAPGGYALIADRVPPGLVASFRSAGEIPSGWTRESALDGRIMVGGGVTFGVTFTEPNSYGGNWTPAVGVSVADGLTVGNGSLGVSSIGATGSVSAGVDPVGGGTVASTLHTHPAPTLTGAVARGGSVAIAGTSTAWVPPCKAYVFARRG